MDGFHRPNAELVAMGRLDAKGAPDTFDAEGYAALLRRLQCGGDVLAPSFDHGQPDPVPDAIEIPCEAGLVVTEGNYLLLDEPAGAPCVASATPSGTWSPTRPSGCSGWSRGMSRPGKAPDDAREWVAQVDQANADLVEAAAGRADQVLDLSTWSGGIKRPGPERDA